MGVFPKRLSGSMDKVYECTQSTTKDLYPDPNPKEYTILSSQQIENYLIVLIQYTGCTNYEGKKILVYKSLTLKELKSMKEIDPHFLKTGVSPIARFVPTVEGWNMAVTFVTAMSVL